MLQVACTYVLVYTLIFCQSNVQNLNTTSLRSKKTNLMDKDFKKARIACAFGTLMAHTLSKFTEEYNK